MRMSLTGLISYEIEMGDSIDPRIHWLPHKKGNQQEYASLTSPT